ncbi:MAG: hypothetical protein FWF57_01425 [Defluviitaleaceae bacterium]|nr:hypothetical protein [Defluviitaleaceae bacterium]
MSNTKPLYVPTNIKRRYEIMAGLGFKELILIGTYATIGLILSFVLGIFLDFNVLDRIFFMIVGGLISGFLFIQNENNQSVYSFIKLIIRFNKKQRIYNYVYYNKFKVKE